MLSLFLAAAALPAAADPWKNESGHGRDEGRGGGPPPWARGRGGRGNAEIYIPPDALDLDLRCNRDIAGGVIGGAVGGILGSQIGDGDQRTLATLGGAVIGDQMQARQKQDAEVQRQMQAQQAEIERQERELNQLKAQQAR